MELILNNTRWRVAVCKLGEYLHSCRLDCIPRRIPSQDFKPLIRKQVRHIRDPLLHVRGIHPCAVYFRELLFERRIWAWRWFQMLNWRHWAAGLDDRHEARGGRPPGAV